VLLPFEHKCCGSTISGHDRVWKLPKMPEMHRFYQNSPHFSPVKNVPKPVEAQIF